MEFNIAKARATGASHINRKTICQDSGKVAEYQSGVVLAVADGHGSEKCKYSDVGAQKAVNAFHDVLSGIMKNQTAQEAETLIKALKDDGIPKKVNDEWQRKIEKFHSMNYKKESFSPILYGTTLLGIAILPTCVYALQIGDGDIITVSDSDVGNLIVAPLIQSEKILGTETDSLASQNSINKIVTKMQFYQEDDEWPLLFMLSTDGLVNSFTTVEGFYKCATDYVDVIRNHGFTTLKANMIGWLKDTTKEGCGDDITIAIAAKTDLQRMTATIDQMDVIMVNANEAGNE